ncbi:MAG TPA: aminodeoxychorismate synthase component I, partial [Gammaproteobacteria bacterium]|nr:aminodeoxychorismate synthase component I [Gammaproteobacteria bacterium]
MPIPAAKTGAIRPVRTAELPYRPDSAELFRAVAAEPWAALLDSGPAEGRAGRYDILVAEPWATVTSGNGVTEVRTDRGSECSGDDPFAVLRRLLGPRADSGTGLPFVGGALGYFGYDLARRLERLPERAEDGEALPELAVGLYDWAVVVDHRLQRTWLVDGGRDPATAERWRELRARFSEPHAVTA